MRCRAFITSLSLSLLFLAVYGSINWFTSTRTDVGTWVYGWERHVPFVPLMIVPYMSIDLFYVAGPFLCRDREELQLLSRRIAFAILVAGAFFLAMPLRFTFDRPQVEGWLGAVFNRFREMDQPFNLFPSLHIVLRTILADLYFRHTRGVVRWTAAVWFSLVGASTLLVYQHHIVDVIGGFVLAAVCFYVFADSSRRGPVSTNKRIAAYYGIGTAALCAAGYALRPWGTILFWPAASTCLVTAGYLGLGAAVYRKSNGRLPLGAKLLLGPVLLGQWLSLRHYARRSNAWDRVTDGLWIGRVLSQPEAEEAMRQGVVAVVDLTGEFSEAKPLLRVPYLNVPVLDLTAPTADQVGRALRFISEHAARGAVYLHCKAGYSRSAAVAGAYLISESLAESPGAAAAMLRSARRGMVIRPEAMAVIEAFAAPVQAAESAQSPSIHIDPATVPVDGSIGY